MGIAPAHCRLCGERHWSYEPHKYPGDMKVRSEPEPQAVSVTTGLSVTEEPLSVTPGVDEVLSVTARYPSPLDGKSSCVDCGELYEPQRSTSKYCSATCRKRASRKAKSDA